MSGAASSATLRAPPPRLAPGLALRLAETLRSWPKADVVALSRLLSRFVADLERQDTATATVAHRGAPS